MYLKINIPKKIKDIKIKNNLSSTVALVLGD
jgi:hypothetical protein